MFVSLAVPIAAVVAAQDSPPVAEFGPVSYFHGHCARCHGPSGAYYDLKHLALSSDEKLRQIISDMADGPGQAPLTSSEVLAEVALHRSFLDGKPFVSVNKPKPAGTALIISGEVTPESKVTLTLGKTTVAATIDGAAWQATVPANADLKTATITATNGDGKTELRLANGYSHKK